MSYSYSSCYCYECLKMDLSDRNKYDNEKAYCTGYNRYIDIHDRACSKYFIYDESKKSPSGCYLTTTMCEILNFDDDNILLNTLRDFRENYLKKNKELLPILFEYDIVGPIISNCIKNDPKRLNISKCLFKNYIRPVVCLIKQNKYNEAINLYKEMTNNLKILYAIDIEAKEYNYNIKTLGKART